MHLSSFKKNKIEIVILWIIPIFNFLISFFYWSNRNYLSYFGFLILAPATFAAVAVGIAAGPLKLWQWNTSIFPRVLFIQRPLVYAAYLNLVFVFGGRLLTLPTTTSTLVESAFTIGIIGMMVGVLHDIFGVDVGLYKISGKRFDTEQFGTILVVSRYGFFFFGSISIFLGVAAKAGYYFIYENPISPFSWPILGFSAGMIASLPILFWGTWRFLIKRKKHLPKSAY